MISVVSNLQTLNQLRNFLHKSPAGLMDQIGSHVRHALDHYDCFFRGLEANFINYDKRDRDKIIESDKTKALEKIDTLIKSLTALGNNGADSRINVKVDCGSPLEEDSLSQSTIKRELQYLCLHDIHHFALITNIIKDLNISLEAEFGLAPSTLKHRQSQEDVHRNLAPSR